MAMVDVERIPRFRAHRLTSPSTSTRCERVSSLSRCNVGFLDEVTVRKTRFNADLCAPGSGHVDLDDGRGSLAECGRRVRASLNQLLLPPSPSPSYFPTMTRRSAAADRDDDVEMEDVPKASSGKKTRASAAAAEVESADEVEVGEPASDDEDEKPEEGEQPHLRSNPIRLQIQAHLLIMMGVLI